MYRALTRDIEVTVEPYYLEPTNPTPTTSRYVWGYTGSSSPTIPTSPVTARSTRYWHITDQNGQVDEVNGPGVVGEQPTAERPGDTLRILLRLPAGNAVRPHVRPLPHGSGQTARPSTSPYPPFRWIHRGNRCTF
jgi:hypothetical protein